MVTMWQAFKNFWRGYVDFSGRATRAEYWWWALWQVIFGMLFIGVVLIVALADSARGEVASINDIAANPSNPLASFDFGANGGAPVIVLVLLLIGLGLITFLPNLALTIRRFRDAGLQTWTAWVLWVLSGVGGGVLNMATSDETTVVLGIGGAVFGVIAFVVSIIPSDKLRGVKWIGRAKEATAPSSAAPINQSEDEL